MSDQQILEKLGLLDIPKEVQEETLQDINRIIELRVMGLVDDIMTEDQKKAFSEKVKEAPEEGWKWLSKEVVEISELYDATLEDYINERISK